MDQFIDFLVRYDKVVVALVGTVVGFLLSSWKDNSVRSRRCKAHWEALSAEAELCNERVKNFLKEQYRAPLYRLPLLTYQSSFPALLADGAVTEHETKAISRFFCEVETLNRGLVLAQEARGDKRQLTQEDSRNRKKAMRLGNGDLYQEIRNVIVAHL